MTSFCRLGVNRPARLGEPSCMSLGEPSDGSPKRSYDNNIDDTAHTPNITAARPILGPFYSYISLYIFFSPQSFCSSHHHSTMVYTDSALDSMYDLEYIYDVTSSMRGHRWDHERLCWDDHVDKLLHENQFDREYRMSLRSHSELVRILDPILERCEYNSRCSEPIQVEHITGLGMRVVAGGTLADNRTIFGMSKPESYNSFNAFLHAVNTAPELAIKLPSGKKEWDSVNASFRAKSTNEIISGASLAVDGFFQRTNMPTKKEVQNVTAYYSGHYEHYGVNCQAAVKPNLEFGFFGVCGPGNMNDQISFPLCTALVQAMNSLPEGRYFVGDAAYTLTEKMLIPFTGTGRLEPNQDAFNYYLSQVRIRVEMAFGRLVNKFRILNGKVEGPLSRVADILTACARLHNFIIRQDGLVDIPDIDVEDEMGRMDITADPIAPSGMRYLPIIPNDEFHSYPGVSHTRDAIVDMIRDYTYRRPLHNVLRKKMADEVFASPLGGDVHRVFFSPR